MDITLNIDGLPLNSRLSSYTLQHEVYYKRVVTTLDDVEHAYPAALRPILSFSLLPATEEEDTELYDKLKALFVTVTYIDKGLEVTRLMRLVSNLESAFLLKSVDGKRRYRNGIIQLRGV